MSHVSNVYFTYRFSLCPPLWIPPFHPVTTYWLTYMFIYSITCLFPPLCFPSENTPPVLQSMPFHLQSFQGENFMYQLQAQDPEGSAVFFTLISGPEGASLSPAGLLTWKATAETTDTHTFRFTVTDDCNAETRASVQVVLGLSFFHVVTFSYSYSIQHHCLRSGKKLSKLQSLQSNHKPEKTIYIGVISVVILWQYKKWCIILLRHYEIGMISTCQHISSNQICIVYPGWVFNAYVYMCFEGEVKYKLYLVGQ